jgi:hypothetical protein
LPSLSKDGKPGEGLIGFLFAPREDKELIAFRRLGKLLEGSFLPLFGFFEDQRRPIFCIGEIFKILLTLPKEGIFPFALDKSSKGMIFSIENSFSLMDLFAGGLKRRRRGSPKVIHIRT